MYGRPFSFFCNNSKCVFLIFQEIDESSSDSIVELDAEDPLADPLGSAPASKPEAEKSKTTSNGAKILTLDNVKAIQNLAAKQQPRESKVTLIDTR